MKTRLDQLLVARGLAPSRERAKAAIMAGKVKVDGRVVDKAGHQVGEGAEVALEGPEHPFVSRGGVKLAGALDHFALNPAGFDCLDIGSSTGGFADCLLQRGAAGVSCVDVGYGQLAWKLRTDPKITLLERVNARKLAPDQVPGPFDLATADVSFISLTLVAPCMCERLKYGGFFLGLVKPQFESGREAVGKGGVVRDPTAWRGSIDKVAACLTGLGLTVLGDCESPIVGPAGNHEFFVLAKKNEKTDN